MIDPFDIFIGFLSGLATGIAVQYFWFKYASRIEKMKRLSPYLESVYPIVEKLNQDSEYALKVHFQEEEEHLTLVLKKIATSLEEYAIWFAQFKENGMIPELESLNVDLSRRFIGLFTYARLGNKHGLEYLSQRVQRLAGYCSICQQRLKSQLSI